VTGVEEKRKGGKKRVFKTQGLRVGEKQTPGLEGTQVPNEVATPKDKGIWIGRKCGPIESGNADF